MPRCSSSSTGLSVMIDCPSYLLEVMRVCACATSRRRDSRPGTAGIGAARHRRGANLALTPTPHCRARRHCRNVGRRCPILHPRRLDCETAPKRDPTWDRAQPLDALTETLFRVGSRSAPIGTPTSGALADDFSDLLLFGRGPASALVHMRQRKALDQIAQSMRRLKTGGPSACLPRNAQCLGSTGLTQSFWRYRRRW